MPDDHASGRYCRPGATATLPPMPTADNTVREIPNESLEQHMALTLQDFAKEIEQAAQKYEAQRKRMAELYLSDPIGYVIAERLAVKHEAEFRTWVKSWGLLARRVWQGRRIG